MLCFLLIWNKSTLIWWERNYQITWCKNSFTPVSPCRIDCLLFLFTWAALTDLLDSNKLCSLLGAQESLAFPCSFVQEGYFTFIIVLPYLGSVLCSALHFYQNAMHNTQIEQTENIAMFYLCYYISRGHLMTIPCVSVCWVEEFPHWRMKLVLWVINLLINC